MNQGPNPATTPEASVGQEVERLVASARDALTDEMVARLAATAGDGLDLLDRVNRSGVARALPAITQLVENGDLERLVSLARLIAAVEDSLSDDIVHRLGLVVTGLAALVDKLARNEGFLKLVDLLGREDVQGALADLTEAACAARAQAAQLPPSKGGLANLWHLVKDPATADALRFMGLVSERLRQR